MTESTNDKIVELKVPINVTTIAKEVYQNFPEAGMCLSCINWRYGDTPGKPFMFVFEDLEDEDDEGNSKLYKVDLEMAEKGIQILMEKILAKDYHFDGIDGLEDLLELGNWDAWVVDAAAQCAIFGEVIYG